MSSSPLSPRVVHGALGCVDPATLATTRVMTFPYNPETLTRTLESASPAPRPALPAQADLPAAPRQVIRFVLQLDATDQLESPDRNPLAVQFGVYPLLSALEMLMYPPNTSEDALTLFAWGANLLVPVRVAELESVEQLFDPRLNPIRAEVRVTLWVWTEADFPPGSRLRKFWDVYFANLAKLAGLLPNGTLEKVRA